MWGLLKGGAYFNVFNVDTQRRSAHKRVVLIRGNIVLLGLAQLYLYCTFFILLYFSYHILIKYVNLKDNWEKKFAPSW